MTSYKSRGRHFVAVQAAVSEVVALGFLWAFGQLFTVQLASVQ